MKTLQHFTVCFFVIAIVFVLSCQKELSCENCSAANKPPIAIAGADQWIVVPADSVFLDGSASYDPDGTILLYKWVKISGPSSASIIQPDSSKVLVTSLLMGVYQFELMVKDNGGLSAKDTMTVVVNDPAVNQPPIARAGADQTISLPLDSVLLSGHLSFDPDGTIGSYQWSKISGPPSSDITNPASVQTKVDQLQQGVYQFELKVTDDGGLFGNDTVQVTVVSLPPVPACDITNRPLGTATFTISSQIPQPRYGVTIAAVETKLLIAGSYTSLTGIDPAGFSSRVDIYDITTGQWTVTQMSEPFAFGAVAVLGNKIFFGGGQNGNGLRTKVDIYDVSSNTWSITQLSQARVGIAGGVLNSKVFFAGGIVFMPSLGHQLSNLVDVYDANTHYSSTASLSEGRYCINDLEKITVTIVGENIFFSGGSCNTIQDCSSNRIDIYNAVTNTWSFENYSAQNGGSLFSGIATGNKNYRVTGEYWAGGNMVEIRDEITHATTNVCLSGTLFRPPVKKGNKLLFPVSTASQGSLAYKLTHFDVYDLSTNSWSISKLPLPGVDRFLSLVSVSNDVYAIDGYYSSGRLLFDKVNKLVL